jgi:hypothetical protein
VQETLEPGASVARRDQAHAIDPNHPASTVAHINQMRMSMNPKKIYLDVLDVALVDVR